MPGLLAAQRQIALLHFFHHVLIADSGAHEFDSVLLQAELEADVAHHRGDHRVAAQAALGFHLPGAHQQHVVAVEHTALSIRENRPVAVAVERHTKTIAVGPHRLCQQLRMRRAAAAVDVPSIGARRQHGSVKSQLAEQLRCHGRHGAVGAVHHKT